MKLRTKLFLLLLPALLGGVPQPASAADGDGLWKLHLAYHDASEAVAAGSVVYVLFNGNLLAYDTADQSTTTYDKLSGLSGKGISHIAWSDKARRLVILYDDNNIDLLSPSGEVANIPQVKNYTESTITPVKLSVNGKWACISTTQGLIALDLEREEVKAYYQLGEKVYDAFFTEGGNVYAALEGRVIRGKRTDNLYDLSQWTTAYDDITASTLVPYGGGAYLIVSYLTHRDDGIYGLRHFAAADSTGQAPLTLIDYVWLDWGAVSGGKPVFCGENRLITTDTTGKSTKVTLDILPVHAALTSDGTWWVVGRNDTLYNYRIDEAAALAEDTGVRLGGDGPRRDQVFRLSYNGGRLLVSGGQHAATLYKPTAMAYEDGRWTNFQEAGFSLRDGATYRNVTSIAQDPADPAHHFVSCTSGLLEFRDYKFVAHYNASNSPIQIAAGGGSDPNYCIADALCYDSGGTLWMTNYEADSLFKCLTPSGEWASVRSADFSGVSIPDRMLFDRDGRLWASTRSGNEGLSCLDFSSSPSDPSSGNSLSRSSAPNEDGTTCDLMYIHDLCLDQEGQIWFGCESGVYAVADPGEWFNSDWAVYQPKVPRNDGTNYADYLLTGIPVSAIAVDGGNRKWLGTLGSGVYLTSPDGSQVLAHFTAADSPLLSDNVQALAVNPLTGELMIGTDCGLCSYLTGITPAASSLSASAVNVYPNPVRPEYNGRVTITGLPSGAEVKVVTSGGQLVARLTATGGSCLWDAASAATGRRVGSGVYYLLISDPASGGKSVAKKIVVI